MKKQFLILTMAALAWAFSSCEEADGEQNRSSEEVTTKFKSYFYDQTGSPNMLSVEIEANTWVIAAEDATVPLKVFNDINAKKNLLTEKYDYIAGTNLGTQNMRITGSDTADSDGLFAILYVNIPQIPEVRKIYIGTATYYRNLSGGADDIYWLYYLE